MDKNYISNCPVQAPGLTYSSSQKTGATTNAFTAKAMGILSLPTAPVDMPDLDESVDKEGNTGAISLPAGGMQRIYTFLGKIDPVSASVSFSIVHSADIPVRPVKTEEINQGNVGDEDKFIVGYLLVQTIASPFVPGSSTFGGYNVVFIDNFGFVGA